ncbi:hypothetical protein KPATCC21470_1052 [Kitasatospora purpeofusca]
MPGDRVTPRSWGGPDPPGRLRGHGQLTPASAGRTAPVPSEPIGADRWDG